ncbi:heme transporter, partial [Streptomyces sp. AC04842]|nr:heme transporter [Streptomyces sp. AC04842]
MGTSKAQSNSYALDYKIKPVDNPWLDLRVKIYGVDTSVDNYTTPTYPSSRFDGGSTNAADIRKNIDHEYWDSGACEKPDKSPYALDVCRQYGVGRNNRLATRTEGFLLDNTSRLMLGTKTLLSANYGVEYFTDRTTSSQRWNHDGREVSPIGTTGKDALNPQGRRSMGSIFTEVKLEDDFFTISASLRYERYGLKGRTQVPGKQTVHLSRLDKFAKEMCAYGAFPGRAPNENPRSQVQSVYGPGCRLALAGDESAIAAWWAGVPTYVDQRGRTKNFYIPGGRRSSDYEKEFQPEDL